MNPFVICTLALLGLIEFLVRVAFCLVLTLSMIGILLFILIEDVPIEPLCWDMIKDELKTGKDGLTKRQRQEVAFMREKERHLARVRELEAESWPS